ncbi:MAG: hypothetical protein R3B99_01720 [Polyangiales bacterium]
MVVRAQCQAPDDLAGAEERHAEQRRHLEALAFDLHESRVAADVVDARDFAVFDDPTRDAFASPKSHRRGAWPAARAAQELFARFVENSQGRMARREELTAASVTSFSAASSPISASVSARVRSTKTRSACSGWRDGRVIGVR